MLVLPDGTVTVVVVVNVLTAVVVLVNVMAGSVTVWKVVTGFPLTVAVTRTCVVVPCTAPPVCPTR